MEIISEIPVPGDGDRYLAVVELPTGRYIAVHAYGDLQGVTDITVEELFASALRECLHCGCLLLDTGEELVDETTGSAVCDDGRGNGPHPHCVDYRPGDDGDGEPCNDCGLPAADHAAGYVRRHGDRA